MNSKQKITEKRKHAIVFSFFVIFYVHIINDCYLLFSKQYVNLYLSISTKFDIKTLYIRSGDNMKKYIVSILFGLVVGFFLSKSLIEEYSGYNKAKTVASNGVTAYFIKYGEYDSLESLEKDTTALANYIYTEDEGKFVVYIGITMNEGNLDKLITYFENLNYNVTTEQFVITNTDYINYLENADKLLENTTDLTVLGEVSSQILSKYEELVINSGKD